jgi:phage terminase large subunit GpA-like protein
MKLKTDAAKTVVDEAFGLLAPPRVISVSQWADEFRVLSPESGAAAGRWRTLPFQRAIFDSFSDPDVRITVVMCATQMVKTTFIENALGYLIDCDPGPTLVVFPRDSDCDKFSKVRLSPMIRDTPTLRARVKEVVSKWTGDTLSYKQFPGGHLSLAAAGSPGNLASLPIRFLFCDEIDKYPPSAGGEGDPLSLAMKRQSTFWNRRTILCCSPTIANESRIEKAYLQSDQQKFEARCPVCSEFQLLRWPNVRFSELGTDAERAENSRYICESCAAEWDDLIRHRAVAAGRWVATAPFNGTRGYWLSELYSPWKRMKDIVSDFLSKFRDPRQHQVFVNTSLAETWMQQGEAPDWLRLYDRRESYEIGVVPSGVQVLVAGCDVQSDRLEAEVLGYNIRTRECWSISYRVIPGDPSQVGAAGPWWRAGGLHDLLTRAWPTQAGGSIQILCMAVDSGFKPAPVYEFAKRHPQPIISAAGYNCASYCTVAVTKGNDRSDQLVTSTSAIDQARQERGGVRIFSVGTGYAKSELYDLLRLEPLTAEDGIITYPAGYRHLPNYDRCYFQGLTSESRVVRDSGKVDWVKNGSVRNEPLDLAVLGRVAFEVACGRAKEQHVRALESRAVPPQPAPQPQAPRLRAPERGRVRAKLSLLD